MARGSSSRTTSTTTIFTPMIGVELEFIVVYKKYTFTHRYHGLDPEAVRHETDYVSAPHAISYLLNTHEINTTGWEHFSSDRRPATSNFSTWHISSDRLELTDEEKALVPAEHLVVPIELSSPILRSDDRWEGEIQKVLHVLSRMSEHFDCQLLTNRTTGLHVHIGRPKHGNSDTRFPLNVAKRLFQLVTAHERSLDRISTTDRALALDYTPWDEASVDSLPGYLPPSFWHRHNGNSLSSNVLTWLETIEGCETYQDLGLLTTLPEDRYGHPERFGTGKWSAYNFDNLVVGAGETHLDKKGTVEFRMHAGTLDYFDIIHCVELYLRMVEFCQRARDDEFLHVLTQSTNVRFDLLQFLQALNCSEAVERHFLHDENHLRERRPKNCPYSNPNPLSDPGPLTALVAQNRDDKARSNEWENISRKLYDKLMSGRFYGVKVPLVPGVYSRPQAINTALNAASARAIAQHGSGARAQSAARANVLSNLALEYDLPGGSGRST